MAKILEAADLPPILVASLRPWANALETAALGMGELVTNEAANSSVSLKRRIRLTASIDAAISEACAASNALARDLNGRGAAPTEARANAVEAMTKLVDCLKKAAPNDSTKALGFSW